MIDKDFSHFHLHCDEVHAKHSHSHCGGADEISWRGTALLKNMRSYIGGFSDENCTIRKIKDFHKGEETCLDVEGYLPYGGESEFRHNYRYSPNRLRIASDINFRGQTSVERHFGLSSFELPGTFKKIGILPPARHISEGSEFHSRPIPKWQGKDIMLGHWHRPPMALQLTRKDNTIIEIATGFDIWRWEQNLGYHPESGSYKIILQETGLKVIREVLACCEEFLPEQRNYRFSSFISWHKGKKTALRLEKPVMKLPVMDNQFDPDWKQLEASIEKSGEAYVKINALAFAWPDSTLRSPTEQSYICGLVSHEPCWASSLPLRHFKKIIRRLIETPNVSGIIICGLREGLCYNSAHIKREDLTGTAHWGINTLDDLVIWAEKSCRDKMPLHIERLEEDGHSLTVGKI